jgi:hypothetical protein
MNISDLSLSIKDIPYGVINNIFNSLESNYIIVGTTYNNIVIFKQRDSDNIYSEYQRLGVVQNINSDLGHIRPINSVDSSANGNIIVSSSLDSTIRIWRRKMNGEYVLFQTISYDEFSVTSVRITQDGNNIISANIDKIIIWRRQSDNTYVLQQILNLEQDKQIQSLEISDNGRVIISGFDDSSILIWTLELNNTYVLTQTLGEIYNRNNSIGHVKAIGDINIINENTIVSGSFDRTLIIWTKQSNGMYIMSQRLGVVRNNDRNFGHVDWIESVAATNNGNMIISGSIDNTLIIWKKHSNGTYIIYQRLGDVNNQDPDIGHTSGVHSINILNNGKTIISESFREIIIWTIGLDGFYILQQIINYPNIIHGKAFSRILSYREIIALLADRTDTPEYINNKLLNVNAESHNKTRRRHRSKTRRNCKTKTRRSRKSKSRRSRKSKTRRSRKSKTRKSRRSCKLKTRKSKRSRKSKTRKSRRSRKSKTRKSRRSHKSKTRRSRKSKTRKTRSRRCR